MLRYLSNFLLERQFIPHGHCYLWKPGLLGLHILSDLLITLSYYAIPAMLVFFVCRRQDVPYTGIFLLFSTFIVACGTTHALEIWTLWYPTYWLSGFIKAITALVSVSTAMKLVSLIPRALALPSPAQLEMANLALQNEIAERKQTESALRQSEQKLSLHVQQTPLAVIEWNLKIEVSEWNPGATRIFGYSKDEAIGLHVVGLVPESARDHIDRVWNSLITKKSSIQSTNENLTKDGRIIVCEWYNTPLIDSQGNVIGVTSLAQDITLRQQAELVLQQLNTNLESLVQERTVQLQKALSFEAMLKRITDRVRDSLDESQILQTTVEELVLGLGLSGCNASQYNLTDNTSTICYEYVSNIPPYQCRTMRMADYPEIYNQLLGGQNFQFCSIFPNPVRGHVAVLTCPIQHGEGVLGDLWLINQPAHAFSELEIRLLQQVANQCAIAIRQARLYQASLAQVEELEKLNQLKDDFLSTVSHELRTPVTNMKMAIHMLKTATTSKAKERYLNVLDQECAREIELINNLLDLQRLEAAAYLTSQEDISLEDWLPELIEPFQLRTQERQQTLRLLLPSGLQVLSSDRASLGRVLAELLNNAYKYTPSKGEIVFSVHQAPKPTLGDENPSGYSSPDQSPITVFQLSNQAEIPFAQLPYIFDKFYRVLKANHWKQGGTGLGLALVKKLVEQLQGSIQVESYEGWTTFTIQLPK